MTLQSMLLPDEILLMVFSQLPLQDIKRLRLVCHCFLNCSSQFLFLFLDISSASRSLEFFRKIASDDLFRKGILKIVYNTRLIPFITAGYGNGLSNVQQESAQDAFDQCYSVYDLLCYGVPRLPNLREIIITDRTIQSPTDLSSTELVATSPESHEAQIRDDQLSLFILLRALSAMHSKPQTFRISLQSCMSETLFPPPLHSQHESNTYGIGYGTSKSPSLFDRVLATALTIFQKLHHLSIITQCPDAQHGIGITSTFINNLCAFISTADSNLRILEVAIHELLPHARFGNLLFSTSLFSIAPVLFPQLREVMLKGVPMDGFSLIAFLSRQSTLEELRLGEIRLRPSSPDWTTIIDDLCLLLGVQFEAGKIDKGRNRQGRGNGRRIGGQMPMERIRLELENVFEPGDGAMKRGLTIGSTQLRGYFLGRKDNPLRSHYDSFVCEPWTLT
ncbi:hypothetical protein NA56DRAFT_721703 [Hyaloscypha hepaticicola]|uniref:F-box domain-containing protein n=1 Tax=Hyaloscypha hepaticicola TaxID=2082293 RepID=A0A2J6QNP1_9HELO|nr:hypothetical protein NA56DRAFT_721703 [Hyaloscypha hepaticicola]